MSVLIIAGDIGGTNSRLAMFRADPSQQVSEADLGSAHESVFSRYYKNDGYEKFQDVVAQFLADVSSEAGVQAASIASACLAVAGPVINNHVAMTNRGWSFSGADLERKFKIEKVKLINDFAANGYGLLTLNESEYQVLQEGSPDPTAPIGLIGAGTGLGECFLTSKDGVYDAFPCEGGHVEFAPRTDLEVELLGYLREEYGRASFERVVSGKGIINCYNFLVKKYPDQVNKRLHEQITSAPEPAKEISVSVHDYPLCKQALELMMASYGAETGNLGLKLLPYGSIYICGGIAPHNIEFMADPNSVFMTAFKDKGRVAQVLQNVPIRLVRSEDLGLRGAHVVASRLIGSSSGSKASSKCKCGPGCTCGDNCECGDSCKCLHGSSPSSSCGCGPNCNCCKGCNGGLLSTTTLLITTTVASIMGAAIFKALSK